MDSGSSSWSCSGLSSALPRCSAPTTRPRRCRGPPRSRRCEATPAQVALKGSHDARQLLLSATLTNGRTQDLTGDVSYHVADPKIAQVVEARARHSARRRRRPRSPPISAGARSRSRSGSSRPRSICRSTSPTRSCRSSPSSAATPAAATARPSGQNGFKLSLLGFEPDVDYATLVKEGRGRRLFPAAPDTACCCSRRPAAWPTAAANAWKSAPTNTS